ncbi:BamA/TamA family outer membrane protein [soil metagenome]
MFLQILRSKLFLLFILVIFSSSTSALAQRPNFFSRYINSLINDTSDISRPQFLIYPTLAYAPETSWEIGLSSLYVYYANRDTTNRLSEINGFTFITLENQYGIWFDHALYTNRNKWFFLGRFRFQSFPLLYYGIGPDTPSDYIARVDANQFLIRERVLKKIYRNFFSGLEIDFQRLSSVNFVPASETILPDLPLGSNGSTNLGLGFGLVYDDRHNILNVRHGLFSELALIRYSPTWGSTYGFTTLTSDNRLYRPINSRDVLAVQLFGQFNFGETPFNQLSLMGGESLMRGYYLGRYRDRKQVATQVEYRFLPLPLGFTNRWGAALFVGTGTVFQTFNDFSLNKFVWSAGGGIRFLLFPQKDIFTRLDVAFTEEGPGFYIFIGEAF